MMRGEPPGLGARLRVSDTSHEAGECAPPSPPTLFPAVQRQAAAREKRSRRPHLLVVTLVAELRAALYQTVLIPELPAMLYQLRQHDYTLASQINAQVSFAGINWGMFFSVECGEDMAFTTLPALEASVQAVEPKSQGFFRAYLEQSYQVCQFWGVPSVSAVQKQPVTSSIPTLILAGEYDPTTPPANGRLAAETLARGYFFLFPGVGHGILNTSQCA